jgi:hypothetical protein
MGAHIADGVQSHGTCDLFKGADGLRNGAELLSTDLKATSARLSKGLMEDGADLCRHFHHMPTSGIRNPESPPANNFANS